MGDRKLFWACFLALVATSFGFIIRAMVIKDWGNEFNLTKIQEGEIFGVGLWPFAISIVVFSLIIDRIGYGKAMVFAFVCHVLSVGLTIMAKGYQSLYWGTFIAALGNGTVEAVINPVVASMFTREKTKWLNILHAGWPGGLVVGGLLTLGMGADANWKYKVALLLIPVVGYAILMLGRKFPVNERVAAAVPYREMLREVGFLGAFIVIFLIVSQLSVVMQSTRIASWVTPKATYATIALLTVAFGLVARSPGRILFVFLLLIMIPLATTELGIDSWITALMETEMTTAGKQAGWVLVYTSFIMMVLRFCAGPIVHRLSPLGLLATCSLIAAAGILWLSRATGLAMVFSAASLYAIGKSFFWPTMLGVVAERFPKGGALTLNITAGVGMLGVGVLGTVFIGDIQNRTIAREVQAYDQAHQTALYSTYVGEEKMSVFGPYHGLDNAKLAQAQPTDSATINGITESAKKKALQSIAIFPIVMFVCYVILILYFKTTGGYRAVQIRPGDHG